MQDSDILSTISEAQAKGLDGRGVDAYVWEKQGTSCAILALDSHGMTRISRKYGIVHFLAQYKEMRDVAGVILTKHGCLAWRSFADNLFAEFADPDIALTAALEIHHQLETAGIKLTEEEPYKVCIGISYGRVLKNGIHGVMGDEMNVAAKLAEDIASSGQTLLSDAAYRQLVVHKAVPVETLELTVGKVDVTYHSVRG